MAELDLSRFQIEGGEELPRLDINRFILNEPQSDAPAPTIGQDFGRGLDQGVDTLQMAAFGLARMAGRELGLPDLEKLGAEGVERNQLEAGRRQPTVGSVSEIDGAGDFFRFASASLGQALPSLALSVGGGALGGVLARRGLENMLRKRTITSAVASLEAKGIQSKVAQDAVINSIKSPEAKRVLFDAVKRGKPITDVLDDAFNAGAARAITRGRAKGAFLASSLPQAGSIDIELTEAGTDSALTSLVGGALGGALDALPVVALLDRVFPGMDKAVSKGFVRDFAEGMGLQAGLEGSTEAAQEIVAMAALAFHDPSFDMTDESAVSRAVDALAMGAIVGAVTGGAGGVATTLRARADERAEKRAEQAERDSQRLDDDRPPLPPAKKLQYQTLEDLDLADNTFFEELRDRTHAAVASIVDPVINRVSTEYDESVESLRELMGDQADDVLNAGREFADRATDQLSETVTPLINTLRQFVNTEISKLRDSNADEATINQRVSELTERARDFVQRRVKPVADQLSERTAAEFDDIDLSEIIDELDISIPITEEETRTGPSGRPFTRTTEPEQLEDPADPFEEVDPSDAVARRGPGGIEGGTDQFVFGRSTSKVRVSASGNREAVSVISGGRVQNDGSNTALPYKKPTGSIMKTLFQLARQFNIPPGRFEIREQDDGFVIVLKQEGLAEDLKEGDRVRRAIDSAKLSARGNPDTSRQIKLDGRTAADVPTLVFAGRSLLNGRKTATLNEAFGAIAGRLLELGRLNLEGVRQFQQAYEAHFTPEQRSRKIKLDDPAPLFVIRDADVANKLMFGFAKSMGIRPGLVNAVFQLRKASEVIEGHKGPGWVLGLRDSKVTRSLGAEKVGKLIAGVKKLRRDAFLQDNFVNPDDLTGTAAFTVTSRHPVTGEVLSKRTESDEGGDGADSVFRNLPTEDDFVRSEAERNRRSDPANFEIRETIADPASPRGQRLAALDAEMDRLLETQNQIRQNIDSRGEDLNDVELLSEEMLLESAMDQAALKDVTDAIGETRKRIDALRAGGIRSKQPKPIDHTARRAGLRKHTGRAAEDQRRALQDSRRPGKLKVALYGSSSKVNSFIRDIVSRARKEAGLEMEESGRQQNEVIVLDERGLKAWIAQGILTDPIFAQTVNDPSVGARNIRIGDKSVIYLGPKVMADENTTILALGHELGHQIHSTFWNQLSFSARQALWNEFLKSDRAKNPQQAIHQEFREWMADQAAGWMIKRQGAPKNEIHRFFWRVGQSIRKLWNIISNSKRFQVTETYEQFIDNVTQAIALGNDLKNDPINHYFANEIVTGYAWFGLPDKDNFDLNNLRLNPQQKQSIQDLVTRAEQKFPKIAESGKSVFEWMKNAYMFALASSNSALRSTGIPALQELADIFNKNPGDAKKVQNFHQSREKQKAYWLGRFKAITENMSDAQKKNMLDRLRRHERSTPHPATPDNRQDARMRKMLDDLFNYIVKANVKIERRANFFPRMYDKVKVEAGRARIVNELMLNHKLDRTAANRVVDAIVREGGEVDDSVLPAFDNTKHRNKMLQSRFFDQFMQDDLDLIIANYISAAVDRAEFSRVLGADPNSKSFKNPTGKLDRLLIRAKQQGATAKQIEFAEKVVQANMGAYGRDSIPDGARKFMTAIIAYQNMRLLMFTVFASLPDMVGPAVRANSMKAVFKVYKDEMRAIVEKGSDLDQMARALGTISDEFNHHVLTEYVDNHYMPASVKKVNDAFFKYTGLEWYTNFTRKAALAVGRQFIIDQAAIINDRTATAEQKARATAALAELGLTSKTVNAWRKKGMRWVTGLSRAGTKYTASEHRVSEALKQFVDESIMRPNASQRPVLSSHPALSLVYHLKTFMFSFYDTILRRMGHNLSLADSSQEYAAALAPAVAMMALTAAGLELRELIQYKLWGHKGRTDRMDGFDYTWELLQRSGLTGVSQLAIDFEAADERGQGGLVAIGGPTLGQIGELLYRPASQSLPKAIPIVSQIPAFRDAAREVLF